MADPKVNQPPAEPQPLLSPYHHELDASGTDCAEDCPGLPMGSVAGQMALGIMSRCHCQKTNAVVYCPRKNEIAWSRLLAVIQTGKPRTCSR